MVKTIFEIADASPADLAALPAEALQSLQQKAAAHAAAAARMVNVLHVALVDRYARQLNDTGTHRQIDDGIEVVVVIPKRVEWDQGKLAEAVEKLRSWDEDPADYVETELRVSETRFKAWPPKIRDLFEPARTVKAGKPKIELTIAQAEDA